MNKLRVFLIVFGFIITIGLMIPALFYVVNFWGGGLSNDPQIWGTFGDYFGGIFNPILALANLIIFIKLTMIVADMQDKSTKQALNFEKKILTSGLMHDSIKELSDVLNSLGQRIIVNRQQTDWEILKVRQTVTTFGNNYTHLFMNVDNRLVINELNNLLNVVRTRPYSQQNFATSFDNYLNAKDQYIQTLHRQTISILDN
jgi:uncharacterized membrane protein